MYYCICNMYLAGSVPTRLFSEGEVGEEIPSETLAEKAELVEDPIVAGKAGCFLEAEAHQVTPGNQRFKLSVPVCFHEIITFIV